MSVNATPRPRRKLNSKKSELMRLEQRFMFDGAAVVEAAAVVDTTPVVSDAAPKVVEQAVQNTSQQLALELTPPALFNLQAERAEMLQSFTSGEKLAQEIILSFLQQEGAITELYSIFNGANADQPSAEWLAEAEAFIKDFIEGDVSVNLELQSHQELLGAYAAFAAGDAQNQATIYVNADWLNSGVDDQAVARALLEEFGHYIDYRINGNVDTNGDEGELFADTLLEVQHSESDIQRLTTEDDRVVLTIDGRQIEVEMASLLFADVAFFAEDAAAANSGKANLEGNTLKLLDIVDGTVDGDNDNRTGAVRFLFNSRPESDALYSGNNVRGDLYAINSTNQVVGRYYGEVSRLWKIGSTVHAAQMYIYPTANANDTGNPSTTIFIDFGLNGGPTFTSGDIVKTSSDPVAAALNAMLPGPNQLQANPDTNTVVLQSDCPGPIAVADINGNVLTGIGSASPATAKDSGGTPTYTINTIPDPDVMVESTTGVSVTAVKHNLTNVSFAIVPNSTIASSPTELAGTYGTLKMGADGSYIYNVNESAPALIALKNGATAQEVFTYTIADGVTTNSTTLTITITGANDKPSAVNDYKYVTEATPSPSYPVLQASGNVKINDTDPDNGDSFTVTQASKGQALSGTIVDVTSSGISSIADPIAYTYASLTFQNNPSGNVGDEVKVNGVATGIYIASVNSKTITFKDGANAATSIWLTATTREQLTFGSNTNSNSFVSGVDSTTVFYVTSGTMPSVGSRVTGDGIPAGTTVTAVRGNYVTLSQAATIGTTNNSATLNSGEKLTFLSGAIYGNYGYLSLKNDGTYEYYLSGDVPNGVVTNEYFSYKITDVTGCTSTAVLHIAIQGAPVSNPVANPDANAISELANSTVPNTVSSTVITNDTKDSSLSIAVTSAWTETTAAKTVASGSTSADNFQTIAGLYGTLNIGADGSYIYKLNDGNTAVNALGTGDKLYDVFHYEITDSASPTRHTARTTLTITINGTNDAPVAMADSVTAIEAAGLNNALVGFDPIGNVFLNDSNPETSQTLVITGLTYNSTEATRTGTPGAYVFTLTGQYGTLVLNENGTYQYTVSNSNAAVEAKKSGDSLAEEFAFVYTVSDGTSTTTANLTVTINGANDINQGQPIFVNEGSDYAVFTVNSGAGQYVSLSLADGSAKIANASPALDGTMDYGPALQYFNGVSWTDYNPAADVGGGAGFVKVPTGGTLLVRTAIVHDSVLENAAGETFTLNVDNKGGISTVITATINDDGTGDIFEGDGSIDDLAVKDDDRTLSVNSIEVNEASPYAVFTVTGVAAGQLVKLELGNTAATTDTDAILGTDTGNAGTGKPLQYYNGTAWVDYTAGDFVAIPTGGTTLLVRTAITNDSPAVYEGAETFTLKATNTGNKTVEGVATIKDDGTGNLYPNNATGATGTGTLDDDHDNLSLTVTGLDDVSEGSNAIFTVSLSAGNVHATEITLTLYSGTGAGDAESSDYSRLGETIAYYFDKDGVKHNLDFNKDTGKIILPAGVRSFFVSVPTTDDTDFEGAEVFSLSATITGGESASDTSTILDDGTGQVYDDKGLNPTGPGNDDTPRPPLQPIIVEPVVQPIVFAPPPEPQLLPETPKAPELEISVLVKPIEHELRVDKAIPIQRVQPGNELVYVVPVDAFVHTDENAQIEYVAKMVDGSPWPQWLTFDAKKREFRGTPPKGFTGKLEIKVIARDESGRTAETILVINVSELSDQAVLVGKPAFTAQLKASGVFAWKSERDRLVQHARDVSVKSKQVRAV